MVLEKAIIEWRHAPAYLQWDRAGILTRNLEREIPGLSVFGAQPNSIQLRVPPNTELVSELESHRIVATRPQRTLKDFQDKTDTFSRIVHQTLDITRFIRIGFRIIYSKITKDRDEAANLILNTKRIRLPEHKASEPIFGKIVLPEVAIRTEGKTLGLSHRLKAETRRYELDIPIEFPDNIVSGPKGGISKEADYAILDVDYYTTAPVISDQLIIKDWIESGFRTIKQEADKFLRRGGND